MLIAAISCKMGRKCQQIIQQLLGRQLSNSGNSSDAPQLTVRQKELLRQALRQREPLTPAAASRLLQVGKATVRKELRELAERQLLAPGGGRLRIHAYRVALTDYDCIL